MAAGIAGNGTRPLTSGGVARVVDKRPGPIERRRAQKIGTPADDVARGVANAAADALDARVDGGALGRGRLDHGEIVPSRALADETSLRARPLVKKPSHVGYEIANDRQMDERGDLEAVAVDDPRDMRPAGPPRNAVDHHRARPAHADTGGEAVRERRVQASLNVRDDVENRLALTARDAMCLEAALRLAPPYPGVQRFVHPLEFTAERLPVADPTQQ